MISSHDMLTAIARLRSGEDELSSEQYMELLEAVETAARALVVAPSGTDPVATGLWYNHERTPALARLAGALSPNRYAGTDSAADPLTSDREVLRELHAALLKGAR